MNTDNKLNEKYSLIDNEPVSQQPPAYPRSPEYAQTTVIVQQPDLNLNRGVRMWSSGMCSCFDDLASCCCFLICPFCCVARLYSRYGECCCTSCCVPHALFSLRVQHRNRHKVMGSMLDDCCASTCCFMCTACQLKRDMDYVMLNKGTLAM